jgi:putative flippase GtrA
MKRAAWLRRWLKFNTVGAIGIGVQLAVLAALKSGFGMGYLPATALAVEAAVLHNFVWHELWTWRGRAYGSSVLVRLLKFHLGNGLISIAANLALMRILVGMLHAPYLPANLASIAIASLANFLAAEFFVFRAGPVRTVSSMDDK